MDIKELKQKIYNLDFSSLESYGVLESAISEAKENKNEDSVLWLKDYFKRVKMGNGGRIYRSAEKGDLFQLKYLLKLPHLNQHVYNPLRVAVENRHKACVKLLAPLYTGREIREVFVEAVVQGLVEFVEILIPYTTSDMLLWGQTIIDMDSNKCPRSILVEDKASCKYIRSILSVELDTMASISQYGYSQVLKDAVRNGNSDKVKRIIRRGDYYISTQFYIENYIKYHNNYMTIEIVRLIQE
jgi:hypothetical protein